MVLTKLLKATLNILIENAGAEKGLIIEVRNEKLTIQASQQIDRNEDDNLLEVYDSFNSPNIPISIINKAIRTNKPIVLSDATASSTYSTDDYIINKKPLSLMCIPLPSHGQSKKAVYLENNLTYGAFTDDRVEIIKMLASQASISLENSRIYQEQDNLVKERTQEINEQKLKLEEKNKNILDSITYAKNIQHAILPSTNTVKRTFPNTFIYFNPKDIVSGDFYWMEEVGNYKFIAAADCTGHGVPGAMMSVICCNALNRAVREFELTDPALILNKVRELVIRTFKNSENQMRDGMDISLISIDKNSNKFQYAGAYNSIYLICKSNETVTDETIVLNNKMIVEIKGDRQPIGLFRNSKDFTTHEVPVKKGDSIYLFSDGFADQFGGPKGKKYKYKPFKRFLLEIHQLELHDQKNRLINELIGWQGGLEQIDDITIIGMKI